MTNAGHGRDQPVLVQPSLATAATAVRERFDGSGAQQLFDRPLRAWQRESRRALGLDDERPIVMTGHQAGIWHAGILAKWIEADLLRERSGAAVAAIIVDQDVNDAATVEYPAIVEGTLQRARLPLAARPDAGPTGLRRSVRLEAPSVPPVKEVAEALEAVRVAVNAEAGAGSAALQMSLANSALLSAHIGGVANVPATSLLRTPLGQRFIQAMRDEPDGCRSAYNDALARDPHVARPLGAGDLPLWLLEPGRRAPLGVDQLDHALRTHPERIAPRAFLMTAIARLGLCDLFIHGTGGERYERVTEAWIAAWLGVTLAPMAIATATVRLPLESHLSATPVTTPADVRRFLFDPESADGSLSPAKRSLLAALNDAPRASAERRQRYRELMHHVEVARASRSEAFERLRAEASSSRLAGIAAELARSRTWPWALHRAESIRELRERIAAL